MPPHSLKTTGLLVTPFVLTLNKMHFRNQKARWVEAEGLRCQDWLWVVLLCSGLPVGSFRRPSPPKHPPSSPPTLPPLPLICPGPPDDSCWGGEEVGSWCPPSPGLPYLSDQPLPLSFRLSSLSLVLAMGPHALPLVSGRRSLSALLAWVFVAGVGGHAFDSLFGNQIFFEGAGRGPGANRYSLDFAVLVQRLRRWWGEWGGEKRGGEKGMWSLCSLWESLTHLSGRDLRVCTSVCICVCVWSEWSFSVCFSFWIYLRRQRGGCWVFLSLWVGVCVSLLEV